MLASSHARVSFLAVAVVLGWPGSANAADVLATSKIEDVTVFPIGAEIRRTARVKLEQGEHTIVITDLPSDAVSSSIRVEGMATGKLEIGSVDSRTLMVPRTDKLVSETERRRIEDEIELLRDQRTVSEAQMQAAEMQRQLVANLAQLPTRPAPAEQPGKVEDWSQILGTIASGSAEAQRNLLEAQVKIRTLDRQISDLEGKLASLAPSEDARTEVKVNVAAATPLDADLVIRYQVGNASWTPLYDARLSTGDKSQPPALAITRNAEIRQSTGEVWSDVGLTLSTTRPSAGATAPVLNPVIVDFAPPPEPPRPVAMAPAPAPVTDGLARQSKKAMEPEAAAVAEAAPPEAVEVRQAAVVTTPFQAMFAVAGRNSVSNVGDPRRVRLTTEKPEPTLEVRTVPKDDLKAYLYAKFKLNQGTPLLPGQVSLFRDGTFVGATSIPILTPGEEHEMGFGVDDLVRVKHAIIEEKRGEIGLISTSRTDVRTFKLTVKNLHERAIPVKVIDQLPVSESQDIKVELVGKTPPTVQNVEDKRGIVAWDLKLEPDQEQVIDFGYRVVWPAAKQIIYR
ncbi:MAG: mucoidy inhibitor MuiA family protein [Hyphomicrobium sp.]|nr:mucoidy inhibitor MuiA family protein [Hyphomicrobium sp.]